MKICFFTHDFLPKLGGMELVVHYLAETLVQLGHTVEVVTPWHRNRTFEAQVNYETYSYIVPRGSGRLKLSSLFGIWALIRRNLARHFDVLHAHCTYPAGYWAAKCKDVLKIPLVITPHGEDIQKMPEIDYGVRLNPKIEVKVKYALQRADAITSISQSIRKDILESGGEKDRIYDVPNGVNISTFCNPRDNIRKIMNLPSDSRVVLAVGRNHIKKGYTDLIKAMELVSKKCSNTKCIIIGRDTGSLMPLIQKLKVQDTVMLADQIPKENDGKELYLSKIPHPNLVSCYASSDVFVSSSLIEGFALVVVEAMAAGLPVVATDIAGNRDVVVDGINGFLVSPQKPDKLAEKILYLLKNNEKRVNMAKQSTELAKRYDWKVVVEEYIEVYKRILKYHKKRKG